MHMLQLKYRHYFCNDCKWYYMPAICRRLEREIFSMLNKSVNVFLIIWVYFIPGTFYVISTLCHSLHSQCSLRSPLADMVRNLRNRLDDLLICPDELMNCTDNLLIRPDGLIIGPDELINCPYRLMCLPHYERQAYCHSRWTVWESGTVKEEQVADVDCLTADCVLFTCVLYVAIAVLPLLVV